MGTLGDWVASKHLKLTWKLGFIESAHVDHKEGQPSATVESLSALLAHPSARFLREPWVLRVDRQQNKYGEVLGVLAAAPRRSVTSPLIGEIAGDGATKARFGDLDAALDSFPNLQPLRLRGSDLRFSRLAASLSALSIETWELPVSSLLALLRAPLPSLERLRIDFGPNMKPFDLKQFGPLLRGTFPLRTLGLQRLPNADEFCALLANSEVAPRLEHLELSLCSLTDAGAIALSGGGCSSLALLELQYNLLTSAGRRAVAKLAPKVNCQSQYGALRQ